MGNYVANMDLQIGDNLFHHLEPITIKLLPNDVDFLLKMGMILEQEDPKPTEAEQEDQKPAEPEKKRRQKAKSGNAGGQEPMEKQAAK